MIPSPFVKPARRGLLCAALIQALISPTTANAQDDKPWSLSARAGAEYDSNVTVSETDIQTGESDVAAIFEVEGAFEIEPMADTTLEFGYDFFQSLYADLGQFDIQSHSLSAILDHEFGSFDAGLSYRFNTSSLGGNGFLDIHSIAPTVSFFLTDAVFLNLGYSYLDKNFKTDNARDAKQDSVAATTYYFFNEAQSFVSFGARFEWEGARGDEFDYDGYTLSARYKTMLANGETELRLGYDFLSRDYSKVTPSIGVARDDERHTFLSRVQTPLIGKLNGRLEYKYIDASSNLPSADYNEHVVQLTLGIEI